jgi:hypothetical protein
MAKKQIKEEVIITDADIINEAETLVGKSAKIRFFHSKGWDRSKIAKHLDIRYQHVRNVLVTQLKKDM